MAMTEVAQATVTIIPNMKGAQEKISRDLGASGGDAGEKAGLSFGNKMVGALGKLGAAAAVGKFIKDSVGEGAKLQQTLGGIETLFKENADTVKGYAAQAYKTAGLSANDYMESVTSFSASLIKSMDGDTAAAAEMANMAMIDMSDNANKMGTDMSAIQMAYQGFAKQNYTMLDNLKLGYGGTKTEMERLLKDATELSGVEYNIDNLADVYEAIHVIQEDLDITGTTAKEAASTFSGSFASMQAAAKNLMGNLAIGEDITKDIHALSNSIQTFLVDNMLPMVSNVIQQIPSIVAQIPGFIAELIPQVLPVAVDMVTGLAESIVENIPIFLEGIGQLIASIPEAFTSIDWIGVGNTLLEGLTSAIGSIWDSVTGLLTATFGIELPDWDTVVSDISSLWEDVKSGIGDFFKAAFDILTDDSQTPIEKIGALWDLVSSSIGDMFKAVFDVAPVAFDTVVTAIDNWWKNSVWPGIQNFFKSTFDVDVPSWEEIVERIKTFWEDIKSGITGWFKTTFGVEPPTLSDVISDIEAFWNEMVSGIAGWFTTTFNVKIPTWEEIKQKVEDFWNDFKAGISSFFKTVFTVGIPIASGITTKIGTLWDSVKKGISGFFSWLFNLDFPSVDEIVTKLKGWWNDIVKGIGDFFTLKWILGDKSQEEVYDQFSGAGRTFELSDDKVSIDSDKIQEALSNADLTLADIDTSSLDTALASVSTCISGMEKAFENANFTLPSVKTAALAIVKTAVSAAVRTMKSTMNFSWTLPTLHGRLPVISVNMQTASSSDGKTSVSYPDLSVSSFKWFAKGGIFNNPTVIGIGDSKGPEAAVPLDMMWERMSKEFDKHLNGGAQVTNYFTVDGAQDPEAWAIGAARTLQRELRMA